MELSKRLKAIAQAVPDRAQVADIGTDHAYLPIYLVKEKKAKKVIAMDVNQGPLKRAKENITKYLMSDSIETRLSNGLTQLKQGEVTIITISGMGGILIQQILEEGKALVETVSRLVLQPQSESDKVRKCLHQLGFKITDECFIYEDGKYYNVIIADRGKEIYPPQDYFFGKCLIEKKDPVFKAYLLKEHKQKEDILKRLKTHTTSYAKERIIELEQELVRIQEVLTWL